MTQATASNQGIAVAFADGGAGLIPFDDLPEIGNLANLRSMELPNPYELVLRPRVGDALGLPWDFGRAYCDPAYRERVNAVAAAGRASLGRRLRSLRLAGSLSQDALAKAAGIGRVTLSRLENGEQSPRHETLLSLARALHVPTVALLTDSEASFTHG
jgi:DNA-binding XRE family transcriptional regulator